LLLLPGRSYLRSSRTAEFRQLRQTIHVDRVGAFVGFVPHVNTLLCSYQIDELVTVLANYNRPEVAGHVVPLDPVSELVVEYGEAGLVMELLQPLDRDPYVVVCFDGALLEPLLVVGLRCPVGSCGAPEGVRVRLVSGWNPAVASPCPEPAVDIDGLEVRQVAAFVLEVALPARGVDTRHVISGHNFLEDLEFARSVKRNEVHAPVSAEVSSIEPVPILEFMPGLSPGQEVVVIANLHVCLSLHAFLDVWPVKERLPVGSNPGWLLRQCEAQEGKYSQTLHLSYVVCS